MSTPPPGWYPDPSMAQTQRYWDGVQWTGHVAPYAPAPTGNGTEGLEWLIPVNRSWQSIVAGYLGIVALVFSFLGYLAVAVGVLSIGCGVWALIVATKGGHGRGRAIFAIVAGALAVVGGFYSAATIFA